jgi:hypothetical protein
MIQINTMTTVIALPGLEGAIDDRRFAPRYAKTAAIASSNPAKKIGSMPV